MNTHCMIDLEALGTSADSKILSIGAVVFDANGAVLQTLYRVINLDSQRERTMSHDTLVWWFQQTEAARQAITLAAPHALRDSLVMLANILGQHKDIKMWSNGADFDLPMLQHAYGAFGLSTPWKFWNNRCFRTVKGIHKDIKAPERAGTHHNALDDAKHQMQHLMSIHRARGGIL